MKKFVFLLAALFFLGTHGLSAQTTMPAPSAAPDLSFIVSEAAKQSENYRQAFKNLLALETKTVVKFDKKGAAKENDIIESDFLVYQSAKDADAISELRNVTKVNGKLVPDSQKRSDELLAALRKSTTLKKELEKLEEDSSKYDNTLEINGVTLSEAVALSPNLQPSFDFKYAGVEHLPDGDAYLVSYTQTKPSSLILLNSKSDTNGESLVFAFDLPGTLKKSDAYLRGKLWIDANTYRVRREERELFVQPANPLVLLTTTLEYQPSNYDLLVPKKIVLTTNSIKKDGKNFVAAKDVETTFEYSKFRKTETDVKILDDDQ